MQTYNPPSLQELEKLLVYSKQLPKLNPDSDRRQTIPPKERMETVKKLLESERYKPLQAYMEAYSRHYDSKQRNHKYIQHFQKIIEALADYILFFEPIASRRMGLMSDKAQRAKYLSESEISCFFVGTEPDDDAECLYELARCRKDFQLAIDWGIFDDGELAGSDFRMDFLERLEAVDREIFALRYEHRLGQEEIAKRLGTGRQTVRSRLGRIQKQYRTYLGKF